MALKSKNKVSIDFSMASMTDIIFLLLIFFMLTSNFVEPLVVPVNLPKTKNRRVEMSTVRVSVTKDLQYYVGDQRVEIDDLERVLSAKLKGEKKSIVLSIDKDVAIEHLVTVSDVAITLGASVTLATQPKK